MSNVSGLVIILFIQKIRRNKANGQITPLGFIIRTFWKLQGNWFLYLIYKLNLYFYHYQFHISSVAARHLAGMILVDTSGRIFTVKFCWIMSYRKVKYGHLNLFWTA